MSLLYGNRDRAKASEHALFLLRQIPVPAALVADSLARVANRRADITVERSASEWRTTIQTVDDGGAHDIFEGIIRLERGSRAVTNIILVGRFLASNRSYDLAEDAVTATFESLLAEISSEVATGVS